jgi:hypothetical protein
VRVDGSEKFSITRTSERECTGNKAWETYNNAEAFEIPLFAAENVRLGGFKEKVFSAAKFLLRSLNQSQEATF